MSLHAQVQEDQLALFRRVQAKISGALENLPRYMCTETIDRSVYHPELPHHGVCDEVAFQKGTHLSSTDRLRLDVALTSNSEMYSWVGESRFHDRDLLSLIRDGAISTGSFGAFLKLIFDGDIITYVYKGEQTQGGKKLAEFGFNVAQEDSHYRYAKMFTAYEGSFLVDSDKAELVRLIVRSSKLPTDSYACSVSNTLDYSRVHLKDFDALLPREVLLRVIHTDGSESNNRTVFSGCHEFLGESTIRYDAADEPAAGEGVARVAAAKPAIAIPAGLQFRVALVQEVDTETAAAGDPLKAKLLTPIMDGKKEIAPKGAPVTARIVRMREYYGRSPSPSALVEIRLDIKLESVEIAGVSSSLTAVLMNAKGFNKSKPGALNQRMELGMLAGLEERSVVFQFKNVRRPYRVRGLESFWMTSNP